MCFCDAVFVMIQLYFNACARAHICIYINICIHIYIFLHGYVYFNYVVFLPLFCINISSYLFQYTSQYECLKIFQTGGWTSRQEKSFLWEIVITLMLRETSSFFHLFLKFFGWSWIFFTFMSHEMNLYDVQNFKACFF